MTTDSSGDIVVEAEGAPGGWSVVAMCAGMSVACVALVIWGGVLGLAAGIPGVVFFGVICLPYIVFRAVHPVPMLTIGSDGFTVRQYAVDVGFVAWEEVQGIETDSRQAFSWIVVTLRDPAAFLQRHRLLRRALLRMNTGLKRGRVRIAGVSLSLPVGDVVQIMEARRSRAFGD
jgi:hypothetical protein